MSHAFTGIPVHNGETSAAYFPGRTARPVSLFPFWAAVLRASGSAGWPELSKKTNTKKKKTWWMIRSRRTLSGTKGIEKRGSGNARKTRFSNSSGLSFSHPSLFNFRPVCSTVHCVQYSCPKPMRFVGETHLP